MSEHAVFATLDEVKTAIQKHELTTVSTFTIYLRDKGFSCNDNSQTGHRICWQDRGTDASRQIPYNGVPFIMLGREICECQNGPDRNKRKKDMYRNQKDTKTCADHNYDSKSRCLTQPTKKMSCPARIVVKHLVRFPDYKITGIDTQYNRKKQATELKSALDHGISVQKEHEFHVSFPEENDHANHLRGEIIDAFLHIQSKSYLGTYHVNSVVMTAILDGNAGVHGLLQKIILPQRKKILYLNPLGEIESAQKRILNNWYCFLERRFEGGIDNTPPGIWTISTEQHARQRDGQSCGVYVLKIACDKCGLYFHQKCCGKLQSFVCRLCEND